MKRNLFFLPILMLTAKMALAQYCIPSHTLGSSSGDYIASFNFLSINNNSGADPSPYYTFYSSGYTVPSLTAGSSYNGSFTAGTYAAPAPYYEAFQIWIDFNNNQSFTDLGESVGEFQTNSSGQIVNFTVNVPITAVSGTTRMRILTAYNTSPLTPCGTYAYGEAEDYLVSITGSGGGGSYCNPITGSPSSGGTTDGDYINQVLLGTLSNISGASTAYPYYTDYSANTGSAWNPTLTTGSNYNISITSGSYNSDVYAAWIDYNNDGDFYDINEKLGEFSTTLAFETQNINFTVPLGTTPGNKRMRVRCTFSQTNMDPCATTYTFGETEDYSVNITSGGGGSTPCELNLHGVNCDVTDAIDDVYLLNSTLMNLSTGCNSLTAPGYTLWPASGATTTTLMRNQNYILGVTTTSSSIISAWFDWNNDGVFSTTEWFQVATSSTANTASQINVTVPNNAYIGQIRMRVRSRLSSNQNGAGDACTEFFSGETEDYILTISNASCLAPQAIFGGEYVSGTSFNFYDFSANFPTSWSWSFQGGTPATSTTQDPTNIAFNGGGGCYAVTLTVTNACGSNTFTRPCFVNVTQQTGCNMLMFSEYIEGSGQNKALELYNASATSINLSTYSVETYSNGSITPSYTLNLTGTLASHDVYVISNSGATLSGITSNSDVTSTVTYFDGNDAVVLKRNGVIVDKIGDIGDDPITSWLVGSGSTAEYTLVRKNSIDRPSTWWADANIEWDVYAQNTTTYLGSHNSVCGTGSAPVANFVGTPLNITVGQSVNFTDLSLNGPTTWNWSFTGGLPASSSMQNPNNIIYNSPGCFMVTLTVSNAFGNDTKTVNCYVNVSSGTMAPVANFTANTFNITTGQSVNFTDLSTNNPTGWNWVFTGGTPGTSTAQNPSGITYNTPGCYQVQLTASNAAGNNTKTEPCYINVSNPGSTPLANFTASTTSVCVGSCISFTDASTNNPTAWNWSFPGSSTPSSTLQNPSNICYNTPGTYNVSLTAINASGNNTLTLNAYITVYAIPVASAGSNQTICSGSSAQLNASGGQTYSWSPATGLSSTTVSNPIATPTNTTTYTVQVTNGTCSSIASVTVTVTNLNINAGNDVTICSGASTQLNATGGVTYSWSPTIGLTNPNIANPMAFPSTTTVYTVTANSNGCSATDEITVTVAAPTISAGADVAICEGESIQLNVNGGSNYSWSPATGLNDPNSSSPIASPSSTTSYTVTGEVAGCTTSDVILVTVNANPLVPTISPNGIELQSSPASSYQWSLNGNPITGATLQNYFPANPGDYTVTVYNANGCSSTSAPYTVTTVGIGTKKTIDNKLTLYPNPAYNNVLLTIQAETSETAVLLVYNSMGALIIEEQINLSKGENKKNIYLDNFAAGMYSVKIQGDMTNVVSGFIKR